MYDSPKQYLSKKPVKTVTRKRSVHTKGPDNFPGEIQEMVFIAESTNV